MAASIEPGSIPYGERGQVESMLPSAPPGVGGASGGPLAEMPELPGSPIDMMMGDMLKSDPNIPPTQGLSVGAGSGPAMQEQGGSVYSERLRAVAQHAKSPALRAQARAGLKALWSQGRL